MGGNANLRATIVITEFRTKAEIEELPALLNPSNSDSTRQHPNCHSVLVPNLPKAHHSVRILVLGRN
jgi:hypothetical protein